MKFKTRKDLAWRRIAGEIFIVDAAGSRMHELNGAAALVWEGLAAGRGVWMSKSRAMTRSTLPSTTVSARLKAIEAMAAAV